MTIEFNREVTQAKLAINTLISLQMVKFTQNKIYKVKNFAKHQNIRTKEKLETNNNMEESKNKEEKKVENIENQLCEEKHTNLELQTCKNIDEVSANDVIEDKIINVQIEKEKRYTINAMILMRFIKIFRRSSLKMIYRLMIRNLYQGKKRKSKQKYGEE